MKIVGIIKDYEIPSEPDVVVLDITTTDLPGLSILCAGEKVRFYLSRRVTSTLFRQSLVRVSFPLIFLLGVLIRARNVNVLHWHLFFKSNFIYI